MTTTKAAAPTQVMPKPIDTVREMLIQNRDAIQMACTKLLNADRLLRLMLVECRRNPALAECSQASFLGAVFQMAQLGLEPGPMGLIYPIPFNNRKSGRKEIQIVVGYKGLMALARRSEQIATIQAHVVREGDTFHYAYGLQPTLVHQPGPYKEGRKVIAMYAIGALINGFHQFEVMTIEQIEKHRDKYSRAAQDGPWKTDFDEMGKKTVVRRVCKMLPASTELQTAVALDELAEAQLSQNLGSLPELPIKDPIEEEETEEIKDIQKGLEQKQQGKPITATEVQEANAKAGHVDTRPNLAEPAQSLAEETEVVEEKQPISDERWIRLIKFMDSDGMLQLHKHKVKEALKIAKLPPLIEPARSHFFQAVDAYCKEQGFVVPWPT